MGDVKVQLLANKLILRRALAQCKIVSQHSDELLRSVIAVGTKVSFTACFYSRAESFLLKELHCLCGKSWNGCCLLSRMAESLLSVLFSTTNSELVREQPKTELASFISLLRFLCLCRRLHWLPQIGRRSCCKH